MTPGWKTVSSEKHYRDDHLSVATVEVCTPAKRSPRKWTVVDRKNAVVLAAMTGDGKLILIQQERIAIQTAIWEMPAGQIDGAGEPTTEEINTIALRELREETGFELAPGGDLIALGDYFSSPGFTNERGHFVLARPVEFSASGSAHEVSESILDCRAFTVEAIARMIADNEIRDANTLSVCARLAARGVISLGIR